MASKAQQKKRRRRFMLRRKRTLDPNIVIEYKRPDTLKRFITDRGKIIPRRISGATADQQRAITTAIKRARYLGLLPYSVAHRSEKGFAGDMAAINAAGMRESRGGRGGPPRGAPRGEGGGREGGEGEGQSQGQQAESTGE